MGRKTKMNSITNQELISQINPKNIELLDEFKEYCMSTKKSSGTISGYESDLLICFVWNLQYNNNEFFINWTKRNIIKLQNWLINTNSNSPARVRRIKASLSSLSNYIENVCDDIYPDFRNIVRKVENPINQPVREKTIWDDDELDSLLKKLTDDKQYEKACFLALAMYSGRRKAELCRFRVSDFDDSKLVCGGALYKSDPIKTKGRGGGKMTNCYTLAKSFKPYLDNWINERNEKGIESKWLFPDRNNPDEHISISTANSWANTFSKLSGKQAYLHSLRHRFTTYLVKEGIPDSVIQSIIDWQTSDMVRLYCDLDVEDQIDMYFKNGDIAIPDQKSFSDI